MREFQNKTYWIVGASEGLGRALAIQLAKVGAKVIISARSEERLIGLSEEIGSNTMVLPMDVSDRSSVQKACSKLPRSLDGFIFVSGVYWHMSASSWDEIKAEEMVDVNLVGAMRCLAHLVPKFINQGFGHIVLTGSIAGYRGLPGSVGYCASKAGLMSLAETLKIDLAKNKIDVQLEAAAEYYLDYEFELKIKEGNLLTFSGKYILVETSFIEAPPNFKELIFKLQIEGYKVILAHPERYPFMSMQDYEELADRSVFLQLNLLSLLGNYGLEVKDKAQQLIDNNLISFVGTDCHHMGHTDLYEKCQTTKAWHQLVESGKLLNHLL